MREALELTAARSRLDCSWVWRGMSAFDLPLGAEVLERCTRATYGAVSFLGTASFLVHLVHDMRSTW